MSGWQYIAASETMRSLAGRVRELEAEVHRLRDLLQKHGIEDKPEPIPETKAPQTTVLMPQITVEHARLLYSYFKGRKDVFSRRNLNKEGKGVYYPACENFWVTGKCPRKEGKTIRCKDCQNRQWTPLNLRFLMRHLRGEATDGRDVIGIYPLQENETCHFLVFDFDHHDETALIDWKAEINAIRSICNRAGIDTLVERSRSGQGAHVWIFFEEAISAAEARRFGACLLTQGAEHVNQKSFISYDRMLPAQEHLPEGGLGNLIALPLQGAALQHGNSAFVDEHWIPYPDQWAYLRKTRKLPLAFVRDKIKQWGQHGETGILSAINNDEEPWKANRFTLHANDVDGKLRLVDSSMLYIRTDNLRARFCNTLRRITSFSNPHYFKNRALGFSTKGIARIIPCFSENDAYIGIPRGKREQLLDLLQQANIPIQYEDIRTEGKPLSVSFSASLYPEQQKAASALLQHHIGILQAATAFGKTAVGAYLIAARKVNTLVLVHNREMMKNWVDDLQKFLQFDEPLPCYYTARGRQRQRKKHIGRLFAAHNSLCGIVDVAMLPSIGHGDEIKELVRDYGMVIMDECHHAAAYQAEQVLNAVNAKYVYGLTATPKRDDGLEQKVLMLFGPIRYKFTALQRAKMQNVQHLLLPRFTQFTLINEQIKLHDIYQQLINDIPRNKLIVKDIESCLSEGRTPLVLTKFKAHARALYQQLQGKAQHIFLLHGGRNTKERDAIRTALSQVPPHESVILIAIGQYIGEGFNYPRLDTLMLTTPISWAGNVEQYAGRLHRDYEGKKDVIIYDYVDMRVRMLDRMYTKRLRTYKNIGYFLYSPGELFDTTQESDRSCFYDGDSYEASLEQDLLAAKSEVLITSPVINKRGAGWLCSLVPHLIAKGVSITVATLAPHIFPDRMAELIRIIEHLNLAGIAIKALDSLHEHCVIIDKSIVWYGNAHFLSQRKESDHVVRLQNPDIAADILCALSKKWDVSENEITS